MKLNNPKLIEGRKLGWRYRKFFGPPFILEKLSNLFDRCMIIWNFEQLKKENKPNEH